MDGSTEHWTLRGGRCVTRQTNAAFWIPYFFSLYRVLQLSLQSMHFCMQYAYSWQGQTTLSWHCSLNFVPHKSRGLWVRIARKACWLAYCKMRLDAVEHPGIFGILHLTCCVLGHTSSFSGILNSMVVWILERTQTEPKIHSINSQIVSLTHTHTHTHTHTRLSILVWTFIDIMHSLAHKSDLN